MQTSTKPKHSPLAKVRTRVGALTGPQAHVDQTQPGVAQATHRATLRTWSKNTPANDYSSLPLCNLGITPRKGNAAGARELAQANRPIRDLVEEDLTSQAKSHAETGPLRGYSEPCPAQMPGRATVTFTQNKTQPGAFLPALKDWVSSAPI
jgi:hypothetical protein